MPDSEDKKRDGETASERRGFVRAGSHLAMLAGLAGGYGAFALIAARFLYPTGPPRGRWMFVARVRGFEQGDSLLYELPSGATVNITRQGSSGSAGDFVALSSVCPHLGCQVHWEASNDRFFCPCHNGTFDSSGTGTGGPPGDAGLTLPRYPLRIERGLLYIEAPQAVLAGGCEGRILDKPRGIQGPGHDPCLAAGRSRGGKGQGGAGTA